MGGRRRLMLQLGGSYLLGKCSCACALLGAALFSGGHGHVPLMRRLLARALRLGLEFCGTAILHRLPLQRRLLKDPLHRASLLLHGGSGESSLRWRTATSCFAKLIIRGCGT